MPSNSTQEGLYKVELHKVEQILGKAMGYPAYAADQKNFPNATAAHGVCVGEHTAETLAMEAAQWIRQLEDYISMAVVDCDFALAHSTFQSTRDAITKLRRTLAVVGNSEWRRQQARGQVG